MEKDGSVHQETFGCSGRYYYDHKGFLGRGSSGAVYRGTLQRQGMFSGDCIAAIKCIHLNKDEQDLSTAERWVQMRRKLKQLLGLSHKNLVQYHKISMIRASGGITIELVMSFCQDGDLETLIKHWKETKTWIDPKMAIRYVMEITEGLHYLHQKGIIHGDLKPGNILLKRNENGESRPQIGDLDDFIQMQHQSSRPDDVTHIRGTYRYMSPEMLRKFGDPPAESHPGRKTDIWSLGCILLQLSGCAVGYNENWLVDGKGNFEDADKLHDRLYSIRIIDGYVPYVDSAIPACLTECIRQCLSAKSEERISAGRLIKVLANAEKVVPRAAVILFNMSAFCYISHVRMRWFDPYTNIMRPFTLPTDLFQKVFCVEGAASDTVVVLQADNAMKRFETIVWDASKGVGRHMLFNSAVQMAHPVVVNNRIYFWDCDDEVLPFKVMDIFDGHLTSLTAPSLTERYVHRSFSMLSFDKWCIHLQVSASQILPISCRKGLLEYAEHGTKIIYIVTTQPQFAPQRIMSFDTETCEWESFPDLPDKRRDFAMAVMDANMYVLGGDIWSSGQISLLDSCSRLDSTSRTWEQVSPLLQPRSEHCAFIFNNGIYVYGGMVNGGSPSDTMEMYDAKNDKWSAASFSNRDNRSIGIRFTSSFAVHVSLPWSVLYDNSKDH